jgi:hypothetical protein
MQNKGVDPTFIAKPLADKFAKLYLDPEFNSGRTMASDRQNYLKSLRAILPAKTDGPLLKLLP